MRGVAAQRIVRTIRKPRNNADEAIAPKPGWDGPFRAICFVARLANRARRSAEEGAPLGIRPRRRARATAATTLRIPRRGRLHSLRSRSPAPPGAVALLLASPCFAQLIPESLRRDHAGLIQRFLSMTRGCRCIRR